MIGDGLLLLDKPSGMTSHDVVASCRRILSRKDIGHAGTLDPIATGLLVILVGRATKLSNYILAGGKRYETEIILGSESTTDDIDGEISVVQSNVNIAREVVEAMAAQLSGDLQLPVPKYSAIKVQGQRLHHKARNGDEFVPPMRPMSFSNVQVLDFDGTCVKVRFSCSKGSYVRAWAKELGQRLQCGAMVKSLRRLASFPYAVENALTFRDIDSLGEAISTSPAWVPLARCLPHWPAVKIEGMDEKLIHNGLVSRKLERFLELEYADKGDLEGIKLLSRRTGHLISLLSFEPPLSFKIRRVFPIND